MTATGRAVSLNPGGPHRPARVPPARRCRRIGRRRRGLHQQQANPKPDADPCPPRAHRRPPSRRRRPRRAACRPVITSAEASQPVASSSAVADLDALAKALGDRLLRPGDPGYLNAAHVYSTRFDNVRPVAVARCASVEDVQNCLDFVRSTGTKVAARGGGHSYAGYSTTSGLVIDVGPMKQRRDD